MLLPLLCLILLFYIMRPLPCRLAVLFFTAKTRNNGSLHLWAPDGVCMCLLASEWFNCISRAFSNISPVPHCYLLMLLVLHYRWLLEPHEVELVTFPIVANMVAEFTAPFFCYLGSLRVFGCASLISDSVLSFLHPQLLNAIAILSSWDRCNLET